MLYAHRLQVVANGEEQFRGEQWMFMLDQAGVPHALHLMCIHSVFELERKPAGAARIFTAGRESESEKGALSAIPENPGNTGNPVHAAHEACKVNTIFHLHREA